MRVNTLTALPVLKYLLAEEGIEPPIIPFRRGWEVFQRFLKLPAESQEDVAGFQVTWLRENPEEPVLEVLLCRQLRDASPGIGLLRRIVAVQFLYGGARVTVDDMDLWSADFPSLDRFLDRVEKEPAFDYASDADDHLTGADALIVEEE